MKKFAGFTTQQQYVLLQRMGYTGSQNQAEMDKFLASSPEAQARIGKLAQSAKEKIEGGAQQKPVAMATGGVVAGSQEQLDAAKQNLAASQAALAQAQSTTDKKDDKTAQNALNASESSFSTTLDAFNTANTQTTGEVLKAGQEATTQATTDPTSLVTPTNVDKIATSNDQFVAQGTGQIGQANQAQVSQVENIQQAAQPQDIQASTVEATKVTPEVQTELEKLQAATADPSAKATVKGQLEQLMSEFEGGGTPPWASGAMRQAMSVMKARGMGASSMAGAAVVQAAMESAISIASQDANTYAQFEMQNLNNQQQTAIFKAQTMIGAMLSDQGAENAAKQFNASSENQVKQFMTDLQSTVSRFNADQVNAITKFNAGEKNAVEQFNASLRDARDKFNAEQDLVIAQANAKWRQDIATMDTAAQNAANMEFARQANGLTQRGLEQVWQKERDTMAFAFQSAENAEQRKQELLLQGKAIKQENKKALGFLAGKLLFG